MTQRIAIRGAIGYNQTTSTSFSVALDSTRFVGDLCLVGVTSAGYQPTTPVGWTLEASVSTGTPGTAGCVGLWVYSRVTQSGDSNTVSFTGLTADYAMAMSIVLMGADTTTPIDATAVTNTTSPASQTYTLADVTTVTNNAWLVGFIASDADATGLRVTGALTNGTVIDEVSQERRQTTLGTGGQLFLQTAEMVTAGATGALTRTETTTASISVSAQVPVRPTNDTTLFSFQTNARVVRSTPTPDLRVAQTSVRVVRSIATAPAPTQEKPVIVICM